MYNVTEQSKSKISYTQNCILDVIQRSGTFFEGSILYTFGQEYDFCGKIILPLLVHEFVFRPFYIVLIRTSCECEYSNMCVKMQLKRKYSC